MKKLMLFSMCAITSLCLIACSGKSDNSEPKNATISDTTVSAETQKETAETKATEAVTTKEEANITLTIPADFIGDSTQEDLNNAAKEYGYKAVLNADGSATYTMTKSQHKKMIDDLSEELKTSLDEMVGSEDYPNFTNIEVNSDFTKFTITTKSEELDFNESFSVIGFYMYSGMYHVFNGTEAEDVTVEFVNAESGKVIYSSKDKSNSETSSVSLNQNDEVSTKLNEIENWIVGDIWNNGYCNFYSYEESGKGSTGKEFDTSKAFSEFEEVYSKKDDFSKYIESLDDSYDEIKEAWNLLNSENEMLYNYYKENGIVHSGKSVDTSQFVKYREEFCDAIYKATN